jgi:hypothetical protein
MKTKFVESSPRDSKGMTPCDARQTPWPCDWPWFFSDSQCIEAWNILSRNYFRYSLKGTIFFHGPRRHKAIDADREDEIPIEAVMVHGNRITASAHNRVARLKDRTAHAEMLAITQAAQRMGGWRLNETNFTSQRSLVRCVPGRWLWRTLAKQSTAFPILGGVV